MWIDKNRIRVILNYISCAVFKRGGIVMEEKKKIVLTGKEFSGMYVDEKNEKAFSVQECNCCQTCKA